MIDNLILLLNPNTFAAALNGVVDGVLEYFVSDQIISTLNNIDTFSSGSKRA